MHRDANEQTLPFAPEEKQMSGAMLILSIQCHRRRAPVDYTALNLKLEEEKKRPREVADGIKGPLSNATPPAEPLLTTGAPVQPQSAVTDSQVPQQAPK